MSDVRSIQDLIPYDIVMIHICIHIWLIFVYVGKYSFFPNQVSSFEFTGFGGRFKVSFTHSKTKMPDPKDQSGQIIILIFHNNGSHFPSSATLWGFRSCEVAIV